MFITVIHLVHPFLSENHPGRFDWSIGFASLYFLNASGFLIFTSILARPPPGPGRFGLRKHTGLLDPTFNSSWVGRRPTWPPEPAGVLPGH